MDGDRWWSGRWLMLGLLIALAVPLLYPPIPPLGDLPGHMASFRIALDRAASPDLARYYTFHWEVVGNLGVDLIMMPLGRLLGVELGTKIVAIAIPVLTGAGLLALARVVHGRTPPTAFAALPLAYNYPFLYGFANYCLSAAFALLALALWLRWHPERHWVRRAIAFAAIAAAVWLAHAIGWVMLCVMCGAGELARRFPDRRHWSRELLLTTRACLPLLSPLLLLPLSPHGQGFHGYGYLDPTQIAKWALMMLRDRWLLIDLASIAALLALLGLAVIRWSGLRLAPTLLWSAIALLLLFLLGPESINGSDFVNGRIAPYALALGIVAIDCAALPHRRQALMATATLVFVALRLGANTASAALYSQDQQRHLAALDHVPHGSAVVSLSRVPCGGGLANWYATRLTHLSGMATVRNQAFVNSLWSVPGLHLLGSRHAAAGRFQADPSQTVFVEQCDATYTVPLETALKSLPLDAFDRLWLLDIPRNRWPRDPRLQLLWSTSDAAVYRVVAVRNVPPAR